MQSAFYTYRMLDFIWSRYINIVIGMSEEFDGKEMMMSYTQDTLNYYLDNMPEEGENSDLHLDPHENNILVSYVL